VSAAGDILSALRTIGATIEPAGDGLRLRAGLQPVPANIVRRVREAKSELLVLLRDDLLAAEGAQTSRRRSLSKVSIFDTSEHLREGPSLTRLVPSAVGEPSVEQPCPARRGRVQLLDEAFLHFCCRCGRFAAFGYGVRLRTGQLGRWYCGEHQPHSRETA
jgi:hypothetical protein